MNNDNVIKREREKIVPRNSLYEIYDMVIALVQVKSFATGGVRKMTNINYGIFPYCDRS